MFRKFFLPPLVLTIWFVVVVGFILFNYRVVPAATEMIPERIIAIMQQPMSWYGGELPLPQPNETAIPAGAQTVSWSKLTFQSFRDLENWGIYQANGDGSSSTTVYNSHVPILPRFNRGANRIVFAIELDGDFEIFVINSDGSGLNQLTNNTSDDLYPDWSPNGNQIVYETAINGQAEIYVMNGDGSGQTRLTNDNEYDGMPVWSPAGTKIAFTSRRTGGYRLYTMSPDGSNLTQLSTLPYSLFATWSPDATKLAFSADSDNDGFFSLWQLNADGSNQHELYYPGSTKDALARSWSADGVYVGFTHINWTFYQGNWYWINSIMYGWNNGLVNLSSSDYDWHPAWQTSDSVAPTSNMNNLPAQSPGPFTVSWAGNDSGGSGLQGYDVQVKDGVNGSWSLWLDNSPNTSGSYSGFGGHTYYFRVRSRDNAFNAESWPADYQTFTTVENTPPSTWVAPLQPYAYYNTVTVNWGGIDPGGSGIASYDIQYKQGPNGSWVNWQMGTPGTWADFVETPGNVYYFRLRGRDRAGNVEAWPAGNGDAFVGLYAASLLGTGQDNFGVPITGATIATNPAYFGFTNDLEGHFAAYMGSLLPSYLIQANKNGYGELPPVKVGGGISTNFNFVLPPPDNQVADWGFESGQPSINWQYGGNVTPTITTNTAHSGDFSLLLGTPPITLNATEEFGTTTGSSLKSVVDNHNNLHVISFSQYQGHNALLHAYRPPAGDWIKHEIIPTAGDTFTQISLTLDPNDNLHLVWGQNSNLYYTRRNADGSWSDIQLVLTQAYPFMLRATWEANDRIHIVWDKYRSGSDQIFYCLYTGDTPCLPQQISPSTYQVYEIDLLTLIDGELHLAWVQSHPSSIQLFYTYRDVNGVWSPVETVSGNIITASVKKDTNGNLHFTYLDFTYHLGYEQRDRFGNWSLGYTLASSLTFLFDLVLDNNQVPHFFGYSNGAIIHRQQINGTWSESQTIFTPPAFAQRLMVTVDPYNRFHVAVETRNDGIYDILYLYQSGENEWSPARVFAEGESVIVSGLLIDRDKTPHLLWIDANEAPYQLKHAWSMMANSWGNSVVSQENISIPAGTTTPILSFLYRLPYSSPGSGTQFRVLINDGLSSTTIFTTDSPTGTWQHQRLDVSDWKGQTVQLLFEVVQAPNSLAVGVYVDEVSLGSAYPDMWLNISSVDFGLPGQVVTPTLLYGNRGGGLASNTILTLTLPAGITYLSASLPPITTGSTIVWDLGDVPAGSGPLPIEVRLMINSNTPYLTTLTSTGIIAPAGAEAEIANNSNQFTLYTGYKIYLPASYRY